MSKNGVILKRSFVMNHPAPALGNKPGDFILGMARVPFDKLEQGMNYQKAVAFMNRLYDFKSGKFRGMMMKQTHITFTSAAVGIAASVANFDFNQVSDRKDFLILLEALKATGLFSFTRAVYEMAGSKPVHSFTRGEDESVLSADQIFAQGQYVKALSVFQSTFSERVAKGWKKMNEGAIKGYKPDWNPDMIMDLINTYQNVSVKDARNMTPYRSMFSNIDNMIMLYLIKGRPIDQLDDLWDEFTALIESSLSNGNFRKYVSDLSIKEATKTIRSKIKTAELKNGIAILKAYSEAVNDLLITNEYVNLDAQEIERRMSVIRYNVPRDYLDIYENPFPASTSPYPAPGRYNFRVVVKGAPTVSLLNDNLYDLSDQKAMTEALNSAWKRLLTAVDPETVVTDYLSTFRTFHHPEWSSVVSNDGKLGVAPSFNLSDMMLDVLIYERATLVIDRARLHYKYVPKYNIRRKNNTPQAPVVTRDIAKAAWHLLGDLNPSGTIMTNDDSQIDRLQADKVDMIGTIPTHHDFEGRVETYVLPGGSEVKIGTNVFSLGGMNVVPSRSVDRDHIDWKVLYCPLLSESDEFWATKLAEASLAAKKADEREWGTQRAKMVSHLSTMVAPFFSEAVSSSGAELDISDATSHDAVSSIQLMISSAVYALDHLAEFLPNYASVLYSIIHDTDVNDDHNTLQVALVREGARFAG